MKKMLMALLLSVACLSYAATFQAVPTHNVAKMREVAKEATIVHYDGDNADAIGTGGAVTFEVAIRLTPTELLTHYGKQLKKIQLFVTAGTYSAVTLKVYEGATATAPGTELCSQIVTSVTPDAISDYELTTPITLVAGKDYWVGYEVVATGGYPAGCDAGPVAAVGKSNMIKFEGAWSALTALGDLNGNWNIRAVVDGTTGPDVSFPTCATPTGTTVTPGTAMNVTTVVTDATGIASVVGHYQLTGQTTWTDFAMTASKATGTYTGTIPAQPAAITGKVKFTTTDTVTPANSGDSPETAIAWAAATAGLSENFDGITVMPPTDWTTVVTLAAKTWKIGNPSANPFSAIDPASVASAIIGYSAVGQNQNEWLITYPINLPATKDMKKLSFYAGFSRNWLPGGSGAPNPGATLKVNITTDNGQNWTELWNAVTDTDPAEDWAWRQREVSLTSYAGQSVKFGFQYTGADGDLAGFDKIELLTNNGIDNQATPAAASLSQNYPNPFNPTTTISFYNNMTGNVKLSVMNAKGETVATLVNNSVVAGNHKVDFDGSTFNSGVYFYKLETPTATVTKKMLLVK